jgi:hypothetical protein
MQDASPLPIEIVVARYRERVEWTKNVPRGMAVTIYDKGGDLDPATVPHARVETLENVGFEAHTYLHHLISRYDRLAPLTVFCQGHPFDHAHDLHQTLRRFAAGTDRVVRFRWLGFIIDSDDPEGKRLFVPWYKNEDGRQLELDRFCRALFDAPAEPWTHFYVGAQFALTGERARHRSRAFYERALDLAVHHPDGGACFERVWDRVFDVIGVAPELLGEDLCRYLKPVRSEADGNAKVTGKIHSPPPDSGRD